LSVTSPASESESGIGGPGQGDSPPPVDAACPLCGATLERDQEWCVRCGAAARTRLAAPTNWKAPILAIALVLALALGALVASLVKLTGNSSTRVAAAPITTTITSLAPAVSTSGQLSSSTTPGIGAGGVSAPTRPGAVNPGTPTTLSPSQPQTGATTTPGATTAAPRSRTATEEALRKAGFLPRGR
jgi:hypothetical protein